MPNRSSVERTAQEVTLAIPEMIARAILQEHRYRPLGGAGMLIGRQTMPYSVDRASRFLQDEGVALCAGVDVKSKSLLDTTTRHGTGQNFISDVGFFSLFCDMSLRTLDVTP